MPRRPRSLAFLGKLLPILAVVIALAWWARDTWGIAHPYGPPAEGDSGWFSRDADGLYHMRRVARALDEGLRVEGKDPYLNYPEGAAIPWPPYYDFAVALALKPFAPPEPEARRAFLEHAVGTAPMVFGIATAVVAALAAWVLAGPGAALVAGTYFALTRGALNYSVIGNGDHTAWVSLLTALLFLLFTWVLRGDVLAKRRRSAIWGAVAGVLVALMLGSWVAALITVLMFQLVLGWLIVQRARQPLPGLAAFGFTMHAVAAVLVLPASAWSPWTASYPWMVVNLSWFHPTELALAALVFLPLLLLERGPLASGTRAARLYPWIVAGALALLGAALWTTGTGPAQGVREGFDWVSRRDSFMDVVRESEPLYGPRAEPGILLSTLGFGAPLSLLAWVAVAWRAFAKRELALLPWAIALLPMAAQSLQQRRFAEALALPLAVVLGVGASWLAESARTGLPALARVPRWILFLPLAVAALFAQWPSISMRMHSDDPRGNWALGTHDDHYLGERKLIEWLRTHTSPAGGYSVLAHWDKGHTIEWAADRPSVATNFGSYVGEDSYRDPPRFFMSEDPAEAEALLARRRARYVIAHAALPLNLGTLIRASDPERRGRYLVERPGGGASTTERWLATVGAMLLGDGAPRNIELAQTGNPLGFLRLVYVSPYRDARVPDPSTGKPPPCGTVWETVPGATVEARCAPDETLELELSVAYPNRERDLRFVARARAGADGIARVRVPYCTESKNGEGVAAGPARWSAGARKGELAISEQAVLGGETLRAE